MRIIYTTHSKYQSKKEANEMALDGLWGTMLGRKKQVPFRQRNTSERDLDDVRPYHFQPVFVHLGLAACTAEETPKQLHH